MAKTAHDYSSKDRTSDVLNENNVNVDFASLLLSPEVLKGLSHAGFERPSPIQLKAIPLGRCGLDLIVQAKSGTGKTCVFSVVILEGLDLQCSNVQALVLAPTREIATQVQEVIQSIGSAMHGLRCDTFIGGTLFGPDRQKLKKCHVAVGTPGRIKQLIEYEVLHTGSIRLFVLDEADKLLEDNFQDQINWIYNHLPINKQMLALSATYPEALARSLTTYMRDPTFVRLNPRHVALKGIKQFCMVVPGHAMYHKAFEIKVKHLLELLSQVSFNQCLVFSNLSSRAQNLSDILCEHGWPSTCISGRQDQTQRHSAMSMLKAFKCRVLISTDLTARGIDAENVNLIVNLDVPTDSKTYMHRIGRAGRFGSKGVAVTLANEGNEEMLLRNIQKQCHVKLRNLPDPVPSDLVNISYEAEDIRDADENLSSEYESDNVDNDEENKRKKSGPQMKTETWLNVEASGKNESSCLQESHSDKGHRRGQRSNHRSGVTRDHSISHVGVADKASQADSMNMPFGMNFPIGFKIPSLAEKLCSKKEDVWSWDTVLSDFEKSMGKGSETTKNLSLVKTQGSVNEAGDCVKFSQTEDLASDSVDEHSSKSDPQDNPNSVHTTEEADTVLSFSTAKMPENESSECKLGSDPSSQTTANYNESKPSDSFSQIVEENEKPSESNKEESENSSDITLETSLTTDEEDSGTPVSEQNGELVEKNGIEENDTNSQSAQELNTKSEETFKVGFFWRPSADFFDNLVVDGTTELAITNSDDRESDDQESNDQTLKPLNENNDPRNGKQIETNESLASPHGVHKNDEYPPNELEVKNDSRHTSASVRPRNRHQIKKTRSSKVATSAVKHEKPTSLAESGMLQPDLKNKTAPKMEVSKQKFQMEISQGSLKNGDSNSEECVAPSMNEDLSETGAPVFLRQSSKDVFLLGQDPIWGSYASYLPSEKHEVSDTSSTEQSDISESDESDISDSDQSSSDSEQDITSETRRTSKVSSENCFSDEPTKPTWDYQNWYPDFNYQDLYNWSPSTYQLDPTYASFYGPSGQYTAQYGKDCSSQLDPSDYYKYMYGGAYAYWPYNYYY